MLKNETKPFLKNMPLKKCIYCRDKINEKNKSREHVIPECFGKFTPQNLVLTNVCITCNNKHLGKLDANLAYNTFEGYILRTQLGIQQPKNFKPHGPNKIEIRIKEGKYKGLWLKKEQHEINTIPTTQIGFIKESSNEYEYFLLDKLSNKNDLEQKGFSLLPSTIRVIRNPKTHEKKELKDKLLHKGIKYKEEFKPILDGEFLNELRYDMDEFFFRGISKIAFNYLAYWIKSEEFIFQEGLEPLRNYILKGSPIRECPVIIDNPPILFSEKISNSSNAVAAHIITLEISEYDFIFAQLALCNYSNYKVILAKNYKGIPFILKNGKSKIGHILDLTNFKINELDYN